MTVRGLRAAPFLVMLALVLFIGLRSEPLPEMFSGQDKLHHALGFAALMITLHIAFPRRHLLGVIAVALLCALLVELGQALQPGRSPSVADMLANAIGVIAGAAVIRAGRPNSRNSGDKSRRQLSRFRI